MVSDLVSRSRKQTDSLVKELTGCSSRPARRPAASRRRSASRQGAPPARPGTPSTRPSPRPTGCAAAPASPAPFPITAYDQLTAAQIKSRLGDLTPAELRKVRDYEKANDKRKGVISAVEKKLA